MKVVKNIDKMKTHSRIMKKENKMIGFVPTMGSFHEGHLSLIRAARKQTDVVMVSVFVNPLQFGRGEDFKKYPRDMARDEELARTCGADVMFCPKAEDMYPKGFSTYVNVENITDKKMEGASRPGHFRGVTTVVTKLFEIIKPDIAYFGQKDTQQAVVIKKMAEDLNMDVIMKILPTVREGDGLAMSSRNSYLSKSERSDAVCLHKALRLAEDTVRSGEKNTKKIIKKMTEFISEIPSAKVDYIAVVDPEDLKEMHEINEKALIALAVFIGKTRLIDNIVVEKEASA